MSEQILPTLCTLTILDFIARLAHTCVCDDDGYNDDDHGDEQRPEEHWLEVVVILASITIITLTHVCSNITIS